MSCWLGSVLFGGYFLKTKYGTMVGTVPVRNKLLFRNTVPITSVVYLELIFSDPDPTFQLISDPDQDPTWIFFPNILNIIFTLYSRLVSVLGFLGIFFLKRDIYFLIERFLKIFQILSVFKRSFALDSCRIWSCSDSLECKRFLLKLEVQHSALRRKIKQEKTGFFVENV